MVKRSDFHGYTRNPDPAAAAVCPGPAAKGICLQKDQILVINAPVEASRFATLLTEEAYKAGAAQVVFNWYCNGTTRLRYEYETQDKFESVPHWRSEFNLDHYRKGAAFLSLISADPYAMKGIDRKRSWPGKRPSTRRSKNIPTE